MGSKRIREQLVNTFDLPKDVIYNSARIIIMGNNQMSVENHRGIIEYTSERIRISTIEGELCVSGNGLEIKDISSDEIIVVGMLADIKIEN